MLEVRLGVGPVDRDVRLGVDFELPDEALRAVFAPGPTSVWFLMTNFYQLRIARMTKDLLVVQTSPPLCDSHRYWQAKQTARER